MNTLLLRFSAPLQSWGVNSKFDRRLTQNAPTRSAILGFVASSLGIQRHESIDFLKDGLKIGVRIDREGTLLRDYHTVKSASSSYVTNRYYLSDAVFLIGLQGELELLNQIKEAIKRPAFPLFLGRRSCPPEGNVVLGIRENLDLLTALSQEPCLNKQIKKDKVTSIQVRMILDANPDDADAFIQKDNPISFDFRKREFGNRFASERFITIRLDSVDHNEIIETDHNPWKELEG